MILTALYAALFWLAIITIAVIGISLYGAHLAKLRDQLCSVVLSSSDFQLGW